MDEVIARHWFLIIIIIPYLYLTLKIYSKLIKIKSFSPGKPADSFVSVIVACRNEEKNLLTLLADISVQDYDHDKFELIIIDDNSSDRTIAIASEFKGIGNLKVLRNSGCGKKQAIRTGVTASSGDLIITADADCRPGKGWLSTIASFFTCTEAEMAICPVKLESGKSFLHRFQELEFLSLQGITAGTAAAKNPVMCNGANLAFTKKSFMRHADKLHDEIISGDDVFLLHSLKEARGSKIYWLEAESAVVITAAMESVTSHLKQRARWISKAGSYRDLYTQTLAIVTFVTILTQVSVLIAGIINPAFLPVFIVMFLLKSIPDFLILRNATFRYNRKSLLRSFFPCQALYPFYVILVVCFCIIAPLRL